jgi:hypothetical protein
VVTSEQRYSLRSFDAFIHVPSETFLGATQPSEAVSLGGVPKEKKIYIQNFNSLLSLLDLKETKLSSFSLV